LSFFFEVIRFLFLYNNFFNFFKFFIIFNFNFFLIIIFIYIFNFFYLVFNEENGYSIYPPLFPETLCS